ncbi:MAG: hypothetical protein JJU33_04950 [Phycisphaerales bacterium]|nr:hypothetical protein [Phycisphaerales bacterium]
MSGNADHDSIGRYLSLEGHLVHMCLTSGLTLLCKSNIGNLKGNFYLSTLQLAVGLERLCKISIICAWLRDGGIPADMAGQMKNWGHDIKSLAKEVSELYEGIDIRLDEIGSGSTAYGEVLALISDYGCRDRYFNIDRIAALTRASDPLQGWGNVLECIFDSNLSKSERAGCEAEAVELGKTLDKRVRIHDSGLDGDPITPQSLARMSMLCRKYTPYAAAYVVDFVREVRTALEAVVEIIQSSSPGQSDSACKIPYMHEFVDFSVVPWEAAVRKRRWP